MTRLDRDWTGCALLAVASTAFGQAGDLKSFPAAEAGMQSAGVE